MLNHFLPQTHRPSAQFCEQWNATKFHRPMLQIMITLRFMQSQSLTKLLPTLFIGWRGTALWIKFCVKLLPVPERGGLNCNCSQQIWSKLLLLLTHSPAVWDSIELDLCVCVRILCIFSSLIVRALGTRNRQCSLSNHCHHFGALFYSLFSVTFARRAVESPSLSDIKPFKAFLFVHYA